MALINGLYGVTIDNDLRLTENVKAALAGGVSVIQYRDKSSSAEKKYDLAVRLKKLCAGKALFIINDDVSLAKSVDADGVHLGKDDADIHKARQLLGDKIIGVSCYNELSLAEKAQSEGADYVAFGRFYSSTTKPAAIQASPDLITAAKKSLSVPVIAIGGITVNNAGLLIEAGADAIAVVNGLFKQPDIKKTAQDYCALFQK
ncbi:MAG: thiamine phosphate synthase [Gammaproteobacteria bacterium]|nr:thiamine phosphate synthase [Gammaproteobacteria bacterium]